MDITCYDEKKKEQNELIIDLYPENQPRNDFKRMPFNDSIREFILGYSFDKAKDLAYMDSNVPLLNGFYTAHINHYPIRIKPDDIWLLIVQAFSNHVNVNSEELRKYFVNFDGKKTLIVEYDSVYSVKNVNKEILEDFTEQINKQIKK